jgi:AcrR family transcriptional regulator
MMTYDWTRIHVHILQLEQQGLVTRTFRRLDPERQQAILAAILEEATEKGPTALNIKRVAERAAVSVGSLYTYFAKREGLLAFATELCVRVMNDTFNSFKSLLAGLPLREALVAYLAGGVEWSRTQAGLLQLFARAAYQGDPELAERVVRPIATTLREMVSEILSQAAARGEIRRDVDIEASTRIVHALMVAVGDSQIFPYLNTYFQVTDEEMAPERALEALIALILHGVAPNPTKDQDGPADAK